MSDRLPNEILLARVGLEELGLRRQVSFFVLVRLICKLIVHTNSDPFHPTLVKRCIADCVLLFLSLHVNVLTCVELDNAFKQERTELRILGLFSELQDG